MIQPMIIIIDAGKSFDKIQQTLMINTLNKLTEGHFYSLLKDIFIKSTENTVVKD